MTIPFPTWNELKSMFEDWQRERVWYCQDCHLTFKESDAPQGACYVECPQCDKHESLILNRNKDDAGKTTETD